MFVLFILPVPSSLSASVSVSVFVRPHDKMSRVFVFQMFHQLKQQRSYFFPDKATDLTFETTSAADEWDVFMGRRLSSLSDYFSFFGFETIRLKVCGSVLSRPLLFDFFSFSGLKCEMRPDWWRQTAWEDEIVLSVCSRDGFKTLQEQRFHVRVWRNCFSWKCLQQLHWQMSDDFLSLPVLTWKQHWGSATHSLQPQTAASLTLICFTSETCLRLQILHQFQITIRETANFFIDDKCNWAAGQKWWRVERAIKFLKNCWESNLSAGVISLFVKQRICFSEGSFLTSQTVWINDFSIWAVWWTFPVKLKS